ncbi:MAG TPA: type II toxin-antitoxin system RelE/ParE family toxin, partial [Brumimicrobium sp.]|nr:type II toxin-antitoxin system RelE/ParE family toxin [Brumimicrobium sp.]
VLDAAENDLDEAFKYYSNINPKLAQRFIKCVNAELNNLKEIPYYQIRYDNFRMKVVKNFPYIIHYILDEDRLIVFVYGIRNSYQNPKKYPEE